MRDTVKNPSFKDYILKNKKGNKRVVWEWIGEGVQGDYNSEDPEDEPLLRFSCDVKVGKEWEGMQDSSYCTQLPICTSKKILKIAGERILAAMELDSPKRAMEGFSWLSLKDFSK